MIEFYPQIKFAHILCVVLSGTLFFARGVGVLRTADWPMRMPVRMISYAIDTALLTAALMLVSILPAAMFTNGWLAVKLVLLMAYIVLGSFALKRASTRRVRALCFTAAVTCFLCIAAIARSHDPLGPLRIMNGRRSESAAVGVALCACCREESIATCPHKRAPPVVSR